MKRFKLLVLCCFLLFRSPLLAEESNNNSLDELFGLDDAIDQGSSGGSYSPFEGLAYNGIDPPPDPDGVPVDGGILTVIGGALYFGSRQLRQNKKNS
jgi:hypothetical protein